MIVKRWHLAVVILLLLLAIFWQRHGMSVAEQWAEEQSDSAATSRAKALQHEAHAAAQQRAIDSLARVEDSLRSVAAAAKARSREATARWETLRLPGVADTTPTARILAIGDSAIGACHAEQLNCERRAATAKERADSLKGQADSLRGAANDWHATADHEKAAAGQWKKVAKGPILTLAVEATLTPSDWTPQAAVDLTLGRGRLRALGRVEAEQGTQSCSFTSAQDAYTCSTAGTITARFGARWVF